MELNNEFFLYDRIEKIKQIVNQYGEDNFAISFSGGKDSTVLSALVDMALPENKIPRLYANTGIDLNMVKDFVKDRAKKDTRIILIKPSVPIIQMLQTKGYPFKSKAHAKWVDLYQRNGKTWSIKNYLDEGDKHLYRPCPKKLRYQFNKDFPFRISDKCCLELKEKPLDMWRKKNNRPYTMTGIMRSEGGRRTTATCLAFQGDKLKTFNPLVAVTKEWEEWFIDTYNIEICAIYKPPYNFERTGCKGCPFALHLQNELDTLQKYFPEERKQCEMIWKPVYDEYRRIGYRLKPLAEEFDLWE